MTKEDRVNYSNDDVASMKFSVVYCDIVTTLRD